MTVLRKTEISTLWLIIDRGCSSVVKRSPAKRKVLGSNPSPGMVLLGYGCTTLVVVPRRSDGTLNRGLVCARTPNMDYKDPNSTEEENL